MFVKILWTVSLTAGELDYAQYCCGKHIKMNMYCEHINSNYDNMTKYLYSLKTLSFKLTVLRLFNLPQPLILLFVDYLQSHFSPQISQGVQHKEIWDKARVWHTVKLFVFTWLLLIYTTFKVAYSLMGITVNTWTTRN